VSSQPRSTIGRPDQPQRPDARFHWDTSRSALTRHADRAPAHLEGQDRPPHHADLSKGGRSGQVLQAGVQDVQQKIWTCVQLVGREAVSRVPLVPAWSSCRHERITMAQMMIANQIDMGFSFTGPT